MKTQFLVFVLCYNTVTLRLTQAGSALHCIFPALLVTNAATGYNRENTFVSETISVM